MFQSIIVFGSFFRFYIVILICEHVELFRRILSQICDKTLGAAIAFFLGQGFFCQVVLNQEEDSRMGVRNLA